VSPGLRAGGFTRGTVEEDMQLEAWLENKKPASADEFANNHPASTED
jgi:hypothetical protein